MANVTPPMVDSEIDHPPEHVWQEKQASGPLVWLMRIAAALVLPVMVAIFFFSFDFLRDEDASKLAQVLVAVVIGVGGIWAVYWAMDRIADLLPAQAGAAVRPAIFAGPAVVLLGFYLVYPAVNTTITSFRNSSSTEWVGFDNYVRIFTQSTYLVSIRNSLLWVIIVPAAAVVIGLTFATLADRLSRRAESTTKSLIFLPMAISFVVASVVWAFIYHFRPEGFGEQIGLLNGLMEAFGGDPRNWLSMQPWNNLFLMVILVWLQTGFAMVILSSAVKSVPEELLEAARIDGASEWQAFRQVVLPSISSTVVVVWTTTVITVWKVFDLVYVMTGGRDGTQVVASQMVQEFFDFSNNGIGAALAVVLFIAVIPILIINIRRFRAQEAMR